MRFQCSFCPSILDVADNLAGKQIKCPTCKKNCFIPQTPFEESCVIGDFVLLEKIGQGSMGKVFKAVQLSLDRVVALKILSQEYTDQKGINDFLKEARAAASLSHVNLVQSLAVGEENGICYMAMNYLEGENLAKRIEREKIPVDEALHTVQQVAEALYYAWSELQIIHRDVKPENIMKTPSGIVKLTDLGLAMPQAEWREGMEISGSPSYMSPEQFSGEKLDSRSDIYSLGITLYQTISGQLPFSGESFQEIAEQHFRKTPVPLHRRDNAVPVKVSNIVRKMIEKLPEDRYQDYDELLRDIWSVRQSTAPNSTMVPDVHTISINRLDYGLQQSRRPSSSRHRSSSSRSRHGSKSGKTPKLKMMFLLMSFLCVFILGVLFGDLFHPGESGAPKVYLLLKERLESLRRNRNEQEISKTLLKTSGYKLSEDIKLAMKNTQSPLWKQHYRALLLETQLLNSRLQLAEYQEELAESKADLQSYSKELEEKHNEIKRLESILQLEKNRSSSHVSSSTEVVKKLERQKRLLTGRLSALETLQGKLAGAIDQQAAYMILTFITKGMVNEAETFRRDICRRMAPVKLPDTVSSARAIARIANIKQTMDQSSHRMVGMNINIDGRHHTVFAFEDGVFFTKDPNGSRRQLMIRDIPDGRLLAAIKKVFPEMVKNRYFISDFALLYGDIGKAASGTCDKNVLSLCRTYSERKLEIIRILNDSNNSDAAGKLAASLAEEFKGSQLEKSILTELKKMGLSF